MIRVATAAGLIVLALAGCVPRADPGVTDAPASTSAPTTPSTSTPTPTNPSAAWVPAGDPIDAAAYAHPDGGVAFSSPSGNIACFYSTYRDIFQWGCTAIEHPELPIDSAGKCTGAFADGSPIVPNGLRMDGTNPDARPDSMCAGVTAGAVLPYGSSITFREMACDSTEDGMICRSLATGHGFRLSRSDYALF